MEVTLQAKIHKPELTPLLNSMAEEMNAAKRSIFQEMTKKIKSLAEIKRESLIRFGLTARQFNSIRFDLI